MYSLLAMPQGRHFLPQKKATLIPRLSLQTRKVGRGATDGLTLHTQGSKRFGYFAVRTELT
jgi:hypothetical protein